MHKKINILQELISQKVYVFDYVVLLPVFGCEWICVFSVWYIAESLCTAVLRSSPINADEWSHVLGSVYLMISHVCFKLLMNSHNYNIASYFVSFNHICLIYKHGFVVNISSVNHSFLVYVTLLWYKWILVAEVLRLSEIIIVLWKQKLLGVKIYSSKFKSFEVGQKTKKNYKNPTFQSFVGNYLTFSFCSLICDMMRFYTSGIRN